MMFLSLLLLVFLSKVAADCTGCQFSHTRNTPIWCRCCAFCETWEACESDYKFCLLQEDGEFAEDATCTWDASLYCATPAPSAPLLTQAVSSLALGFDFGVGINNGRIFSFSAENSMSVLFLDEFGSRWTITLSSGHYHSAAIDSAGTLFTWGAGLHGRLGLGDDEDRDVPTAVPPFGSGDIVTVSCSRWNTFAIDSDGFLFGCGRNIDGLLGRPESELSESKSMLKIDIDSKRAAIISGGSRHACCITEDQQLYCWGEGASGRLGSGDETSRHLPLQVISDGPDRYVEVACGIEHTCTLNTLGQVFCFGMGESGRLGQGMGKTSNQNVPTLVIPSWGEETMDRLVVGDDHSCVYNSWEAYCWGVVSNRWIPHQNSNEVAEVPIKMKMDGIDQIEELVLGPEATCVKEHELSIHCYGGNQPTGVDQYEKLDFSGLDLWPPTPCEMYMQQCEEQCLPNRVSQCSCDEDTETLSVTCDKPTVNCPSDLQEQCTATCGSGFVRACRCGDDDEDDSNRVVVECFSRTDQTHSSTSSVQPQTTATTTTTTTTFQILNPNPQMQNISTEIIIGTSVFLFLLCFVGFVFWFHFRRRNRKSSHQKQQKHYISNSPTKSRSAGQRPAGRGPRRVEMTSNLPPHYTYDLPPPKKSHQPNPSIYDEVATDDKFIIDPQSLLIQKQLGSGNFGTVYKGEWKGAPVAVKELSESSAENKREFIREARRMQKLNPHPNVVVLYGVCEEPKLRIVMEFVGGGDLETLLKTHRHTTFKPKRKLLFARNVACGLSHLHDEDVIHRDISARNVFIDENFKVAKIGDFGMSRTWDASQDEHESTTSRMGQKTVSNLGPIRWMAPEWLQSQRYSKATDIWSYGVFLYELFTERFPFGSKRSNIEIAHAVMGGETLKIDADLIDTVPEQVTTLMDKCFQFEPQRRPLSIQLSRQLL